MPRFTTLGMLLIAATAAAAGIFLLDTFYLRPHLEDQKQAAFQERVGGVEQAVGSCLAAEQAALLNAAAAGAHNPDLPRILQSDSPDRAFRDFAQSVFAATTADEVWLVDAIDRTVGVWARGAKSDGESAPPEPADDDSPPRRAAALPPLGKSDGGLIRLGTGAAVVHRADIRDARASDRAVGQLWIVRHVGPALLDRIGATVEAKLAFIPGKALPEGPLASSSALRPYWVGGESDLTAAWPATDVAGQPLGYFQAELNGGSILRQAAIARRTVLIVLSLSLGLVLLVIAWMHILITGPVVRLLRQLQSWGEGRPAPKGLTRGLHGEPLVLARHLEAALEQLAALAQTDQLTGLANRRHFEQILGAFYHQAQRYKRPLALVMIDIDFFKAINDTWGHQVGDEVLRTVARVLQVSCRQADLPARIGGDEFCVVLPETDAADAQEVADRIRDAVARQVVTIGSVKMSLTASCGIADLGAGELKSPDAMMAAADEALYLAKRQGRNRVALAPSAAPAATG